jgi:hypothetical protein
MLVSSTALHAEGSQADSHLKAFLIQRLLKLTSLLERLSEGWLALKVLVYLLERAFRLVEFYLAVLVLASSIG